MPANLEWNHVFTSTRPSKQRSHLTLELTSARSQAGTYCLTWVSLTLDVGYLFTATPAKRSHCSLPWTRGISSPLPLLTSNVKWLLSALLRPRPYLSAGAFLKSPPRPCAPLTRGPQPSGPRALQSPHLPGGTLTARGHICTKRSLKNGGVTKTTILNS